MVEIGALLPAEPASLVFVTAPVLDALPVDVECVQSGPDAQYAEPAPAVTYADTAPVVEYMTPAPTVFLCDCSDRNDGGSNSPPNHDDAGAVVRAACAVTGRAPSRHEGQRDRRGEDDESCRPNEHSADLSQLTSRLSAVKKFDASVGEGPFSSVKEVITDSINRLQSEASPAANHKVVDIPVVAQKQIAMDWTVQKTMESHQLQFSDEVVDVPVVRVVQVPQVQHNDKVVHVPVVIQTVQKAVEVPQIQEQIADVVKIIPERAQHHTVEVAQVQDIDKVADMPAVLQRHVPIVQKVQKTEEAAPQVGTQEVFRQVPVPSKCLFRSRSCRQGESSLKHLRCK